MNLIENKYKHSKNNLLYSNDVSFGKGIKSVSVFVQKQVKKMETNYYISDCKNKTKHFFLSYICLKDSDCLELISKDLFKIFLFFIIAASSHFEHKTLLQRNLACKIFVHQIYFLCLSTT